MPYQNFTEKEINASIRKKAPLEDIQSGRNPHDIGKLIIDGYYFGKVKIPNPHKKAFNQGKSKSLANQLQLNKEQYNQFIKCDLKKKDYENILRVKIKNTSG